MLYYKYVANMFQSMSILLLYPCILQEIPMNHYDRIEVPGAGVKNRYRTIIPSKWTHRNHCVNRDLSELTKVLQPLLLVLNFWY